MNETYDDGTVDSTPAPKRLLGRDAILNADDRRFEIVECPEWGGSVRLASITGMQRDSYEQGLIEERTGNRRMNLRNARAKLVVLTAVDEDGRKLFTTEDLTALGRKNAAPLDRLFDAAKILIGMGDKDVEKLTENFDDDPSDDGTSD